MIVNRELIGGVILLMGRRDIKKASGARRCFLFLNDVLEAAEGRSTHDLQISVRGNYPSQTHHLISTMPIRELTGSGESPRIIPSLVEHSRRYTTQCVGHKDEMACGGGHFIAQLLVCSSLSCVPE